MTAQQTTLRRRWHDMANAGVQVEDAACGYTIVRLAPGDGCVTIGWRRNRSDKKENGDGAVSLVLTRRDGSGEPLFIPVETKKDAGKVSAAGLLSGVDYEVRIQTNRRTGGEAEASDGMARLFRPGLVPGTVVNYMHPEDHTYDFSGRSTASPSIAKLPDGRLVASHDVYWAGAGQNLSMIFRSEDGGETWSFLTWLYPCFWGKLFVHRGSLYMLATSTEYGALLIGRSDDGGETWSAPSVLIEAGSREAGGPHKAPMPVIVHQGRLWTSVDYGAWQAGGYRTGIISAPEDADLLESANWTIPPFLAYDPQWPGTIVGGTLPHLLLEASVTVSPDNRLVVIPRYQSNSGKPDYGRTVLLYADADHPEAPLTFGKVVDFHGNLSKFTVLFDPVSSCYWSLVNRVTGTNTSQRNILTLIRSRDLEQWDIVQDVLNYEHNGWPEGQKQVGFQYVDWMIEGDDLLYLSRTALNGANNFHDANFITFHLLSQFRSFAN